MFLTKWEGFPIICFEGEFHIAVLPPALMVFVVKVKTLFKMCCESESVYPISFVEIFLIELK